MNLKKYLYEIENYLLGGKEGQFDFIYQKLVFFINFQQEIH